MKKITFGLLTIFFTLLLGAIAVSIPSQGTQTSDIAFAAPGPGDAQLVGWAWSGYDNSTPLDGIADAGLGWISLSCLNDGSCGSSDYGVYVSTSTGDMHGYAWVGNSTDAASTTGWISFQPADVAGCPNGSCTPHIDLGTGVVTGWARAMSRGGGWDGWISLSGTASDASSYGLQYDTVNKHFIHFNPTGTVQQQKAFAWGGGASISSGNDNVIGAIDFYPTMPGPCGGGIVYCEGGTLVNPPQITSFVAKDAANVSTLPISGGKYQIAPNTDFNLDWAATNATSCSATWTAKTTTNDHQLVSGGITALKTYTIDCQNASGQHAVQSITVEVPPLTISSFTVGHDATYTGTASNPIAGDTDGISVSWTTAGGGSITCTPQATTLNIGGNPATVNDGGWSVSGAHAGSGTWGGASHIPAPSPSVVGIGTNAVGLTYNISCTRGAGPSNNATRSYTVTVDGLTCYDRHDNDGNSFCDYSFSASCIPGTVKQPDPGCVPDQSTGIFDSIRPGEVGVGPSLCGNGTCDTTAGETPINCPQDCRPGYHEQ